MSKKNYQDFDGYLNDNKLTLDISVVAANYNNAPFLEDFFESWKKSTALPKELIFIDDGSIDDSLEIANNYKAELPCLIIIALDKNIGFGNALNEGIDLATGKYIFRIDPDDEVHKDRLQIQYDLLESDQNIDIIGSNAIAFNSVTGKDVNKTNFPLTHKKILSAYRKGEHGVLHGTVMGRSSYFKKHKYVQSNVPAEDYDIFARMIKDGAIFKNLPEVLLRYRIHLNSASNVLPISTIQKTYALRDKIFSTQTSSLHINLYFLHIKFYRKFLFSNNGFKRLFFLLLAATLRPDKVVKKFFSR
ncbi:glycosyltransferase [Acinetobacter sp. YH12142]|uniref:glycosyltransferase n=1 Tax=Acinetobacter sp. YH12142 TaxID=2601126 RepID=UPI0015D2AABB|nr:glycosyltransferase [Acinetobacter sp. YH12142]